jgi:hypothetical protein
MPNLETPADLGESSIKTHKPIVYCGLSSWRDSPGNAMYWESSTTAHKMHTMADNELRAAIIYALMEQYEFQRRVSMEQDIWQRADDKWVRIRIAKSFEVLDQRQEWHFFRSIAGCYPSPHSQLTHGDNRISSSANPPLPGASKDISIPSATDKTLY